MIRKYVKKPIPVEAMKYWDTPTGIMDAIAFGDGKIAYGILPSTNIGLYIETLEGVMRPRPEDYIVKGPAGEYWFVKKEIFEATYEEV